MNERIFDMARQSGASDENGRIAEYVFCFTKSEFSAFAELLIKETRLKALEEVRQAVKWADWPITSLSIVEKACEELSLEEPDNRYKGYVK